uniref:Protein tweety homolog n=1 Tax=Dermatophagoides pteronyssinus TaxID=6956 RepID=A0A6P6XPE5_DERPT|nr:protein tweety homolog 3-like [Dermatophagoides pteronyssinus]
MIKDIGYKIDNSSIPTDQHFIHNNNNNIISIAENNNNTFVLILVFTSWSEFLNSIYRAMDFESFSLTNNSGYNISKLVLDFHNVSRYGLDFRRSDATILDHDLQEYAYQMATFGIMAGILFAILTFILFTLCFCICFFRNSVKKPVNQYEYQRNRRNSCCRFSSLIIILITFLTMATYIFSFIGQQQFNDYNLETCQTIRLFVDKIEDTNNQTIKIIDILDPLLDEIDSSMKKIKIDLEDVTIPDIKQKFQNIETEYNEAIENVKPSLNDIRNQMGDDGNFKEILRQLDKYTNQCGDFQSKIQKFLLIILIVISLFTIIFIIGLFNGCLRGCSCFFGFIFMLILALFGTISFIGLVGGSDFCLYSKQLSQTLEMDQSLRNNLDYYFYCEPKRLSEYGFHLTDTKDLENLFNEIHQSMIDGRQQLTKADDYFKQINIQCQQYESSFDSVKKVCSDIRTLKPNVEKLSKITFDVDNILQQIECPSITPIINNLLTNICTDFYNSFFLFFLNSISAVMGYFLLLCITITILLTF